MPECNFVLAEILAARRGSPYWPLRGQPTAAAPIKLRSRAIIVSAVCHLDADPPNPAVAWFCFPLGRRAEETERGRGGRELWGVVYENSRNVFLTLLSMAGCLISFIIPARRRWKCGEVTRGTEQRRSEVNKVKVRHEKMDGKFIVNVWFRRTVSLMRVYGELMTGDREFLAKRLQVHRTPLHTRGCVWI